MKTPVCEQCAESDLLCACCEGKMQRGEITRTDIQVSRILYKLEKKAALSGFEFKKAIELNGFVLILASGNIAPLIGKGGRIIRLISEEIGKKVRVVGEGEAKDMVQDLVFPARVLGMNVLHTHESEEFKVVLSFKDKDRLVMDNDSLKKAVKYLTEKDMHIRYK